MPNGDQRCRQRRVTRWRSFDAACERNQGVAAIVSYKGWGFGVRHLAMIPSPSPGSSTRSRWANAAGRVTEFRNTAPTGGLTARARKLPCRIDRAYEQTVTCHHPPHTSLRVPGRG